MILKTFFALLLAFLFSFAFGERAYDHTRAILSYGPRPSGSKNLIQVQNYLLNEIKKNRFRAEIYQKSMKTPLGSINIKNIAAFKKGSGKKFIVLAAHYESKYFKNKKFLGANDSASAIGILLDLMEEIKNKSLSFGIVFLFLDGEESFETWSEEDSLYGSRIQAEIWRKNGFIKSIESFILLDMVGDGNTSFCIEENSDSDLIESFWNIAQKNEYLYFKDCRVSVSDDHLPFKKEGVRVIDLVAYPFPDYWHRETDTLDKVSSKRLLEIKKLILVYLQELNKKSF